MEAAYGGRLAGVWRLLLTPRWLAATGGAALLVAGFLLLGWWQWTRFESTGGSVQNLGYALQWPFFAGFVALLWWRGLRDTAHPRGSATSGAAPADPAGRSAAHPGDPVDALLDRLATRRTVGSAGDPEAEPADPDLAAYNRRLAALARQDAAAGRHRPREVPR